jgi:transcriptional regulator with XRE-family HTH domain
VTALGDVLRAVREQRGWTLRVAQEHSGIHCAHISQVETGTILQPGLAVLAGLAGAYEIPLRELVTLSTMQIPRAGIGLSAQVTAVLCQVLPRLHGRWQGMCDTLITHIAEHAEEIDGKDDPA